MAEQTVNPFRIFDVEKELCFQKNELNVEKGLPATSQRPAHSPAANI
jgi:hypothetical protein